MHKLNRGAPPACLGRYRHGKHQWTIASPTEVERRQIWSELDAMQVGRCAYCEARLTPGWKHIEHFRQRSRYLQGTFEWSNLFGSCNEADSCGKHKDSCGLYSHADLVKPDADSPDEFFIFVSDGTIAVRADLKGMDKRRAEETLRVFNLDAKHGALRHRRRQAAAGYLQTAQEFQQLAAEFPEAEWRPLLDKEIAAIDQLPFVTAIRHALIGNP